LPTRATSGQHEGAYFGWWNFATKLNLALAAGLALPLLALLGYAPGTRTEAGLQALAWRIACCPACSSWRRLPRCTCWWCGAPRQRLRSRPRDFSPQTPTTKAFP
jgi:hypothetical protein